MSSFWQLKGEYMVQQTIACDTCNAEFTINHDMLEQSYFVTFCPFCGEDINEENIIVNEDSEW